MSTFEYPTKTKKNLLLVCSNNFLINNKNYEPFHWTYGGTTEVSSHCVSFYKSLQPQVYNLLIREVMTQSLFRFL